MISKKASVMSDMLLWIFRILIVTTAMISLISYGRALIRTPFYVSEAMGKFLIDRLFFTSDGIAYYDPQTMNVIPYEIDLRRLKHFDEVCKRLYGNDVAVGIQLITPSFKNFYVCNKRLFDAMLPVLMKSTAYDYATDTRFVYLVYDDPTKREIAKINIVLILPKQ